MVEQRTENPRVAGSIPALGTIFYCAKIGFTTVVSLRSSHHSFLRAPVVTEALA
jgi:hypothetical protein